MALGTDRQVTGRQQILIDLLTAAPLEQITCNLHADEVVVWNVSIERINHPIAISPGMRIGNILFLPT